MARVAMKTTLRMLVIVEVAMAVVMVTVMVAAQKGTESTKGGWAEAAETLARTSSWRVQCARPSPAADEQSAHNSV